MKFKKLEFSDLELIRQYYEAYTNKTCDRTIGGSFMWRDYFDTMYSLVEDTLIMKCQKDNETVFCFPMGKNVDAALGAIDTYCNEEGIAPEFVSLVLEEMEYLKKRYPLATVVENRDWSDYLYLTSDHANFAGRKFTTQRNHINKFMKNYENWEFQKIDTQNLEDVKDFYKDYEARFAKSQATALEEQEKTGEVLDRYFDYGFIGYALFIDKKVVGFSIGEIMKDVMFIHVEKADKSLDGVNAMLVMQFAKAFEGKVTYLNREEDVGDMGLRYSKTKYRPVDMVYKYEVNFKKIEVLENPIESRKLYEQCFQDSEPFVNHYYNVMVKQNRVLVLKVKDEVASMLHIVPKKFKNLKDVDYYFAIATSQKHRHKGYMKKLVRKALKQSYKEGKSLVYLVPAINNLYERFGFGPFGVRFVKKEDLENGTIFKVDSKELRENLKEIFEATVTDRFDDYVEREDMYYDYVLGALFAEKGVVKIQKGQAYTLESNEGIWENIGKDLPTEAYALGRVINVEKALFDENKLDKGYYQIRDEYIKENEGLFYFKEGHFIRTTNEVVQQLHLTEADRTFTHNMDISELILYLKYEKVYVCDEI